MRARSWQMVVAVSVVALTLPLCAAGASSAPSDSDVSVVPTNELASLEPAIPSWILAGIKEQGEFTKRVLDEARSVAESPDAAVLPERIVALPAEETHSETRVPEPTTLIFVGTGLIGISRVARKKKPMWTLRSVTAGIRETAAQEA